MSHTLAILLVVAQALILLTIQKICRAAGRKTWSDFLSRRLKRALFFAFLLENGLEFWFTLLLSTFIPVYRIAILVVMKTSGYILLAMFIAFFILLMR